MTTATELFDLDNVSFTVSGRTLLHPLSVSIPTGCVTALIGHNGSGKSTLLKILARQQSASTGIVRFADKPLPQWGDREFARRLAYLPQHTAAASGMLVKELVALGRYPWHGTLGRFGATDRLKVEEAMELTGTAPFANQLVDTLSGGERQRAWLAMLVAQDADCLLLDEPISALDISQQIAVLSLIRTLSKEKNISVVIVLHDINMTAHFCDQIYALRGGKLVFQSSSQDLMNPDRLEEIYGVPMDVFSHPARDGAIATPRLAL